MILHMKCNLNSFFAGLNSLMYPIKLKYFLVVQPLLLVGVMEFELTTCKWASIHRTETTARVYGAIVEWAQVLSGSIHPAMGNVGSLKKTPLEGCMQVQLFAMFLIGYIIPIGIIWRLEKRIWRSFLNSDSSLLAWPGGPPAYAITLALEELRDEEMRGARTEKASIRWVAVVLITSVLLWKAADMVSGSKFLLMQLQ